jgi:hypothetical protein
MGDLRTNGRRTSDNELVIENEFARIAVSVQSYGNGQRLLVRDLRTDQALLVDPLELEGLAWADPADLRPFVDPGSMRRWRDDTLMSGEASE